MGNASVITFDGNASANIINFEEIISFGNIPINILGRNRNDYQDIGLLPSSLKFILYTENESQYNNLIETLYQQKELKFSYNETNNYYGVPTHIHKHPIKAGQIEDKYILDVDITSIDAFRYGGNMTQDVALDSISGTFGNYATDGNAKTTMDLKFNIYDVNKTTIIGSDACLNLTFGRKDQLGFDHIGMRSFSIPWWCCDYETGGFWDLYAWGNEYILPPINLSSGNCTYKYRSDAWHYDYRIKNWKWGLNPYKQKLNPNIIEKIWIKDEDYCFFPSIPFYGQVFPRYYGPPCEEKIDACWNKGYKICNKHYDIDEDTTNSKTWGCYSFETDEDQEILSFALGGLFLDLEDDWNFDKIDFLATVSIPTKRWNRNDIQGVNTFIWNNNANVWNPLKVDDLKPIDMISGFKNINISINQDNYSSDWNISGGLFFLWITQKFGILNCDYNPPCTQIIDDYGRDYPDIKTGLEYLRMRIYRKEHQLGTILNRNLYHLQDIKIDGMNDISNNTICLDIVNANSGTLGEEIYRTIEIAGNNWSGEHLIPLTSLHFPTNVSSFGIILRLKDELLNPTTLPLIKIHNLSDSSIFFIYGSEIEVNAGNKFGIQKEHPRYENESYTDKSFIKEYREIETLSKIELHNELEPYRKCRLQGPWIEGKYELHGKTNDKFSFNPFENVSNSFYETNGDIEITTNNIKLNANYITYLLSPNLPISDIPKIFLGSNVSSLYLSGDNETYYEVNYVSNQTGYLGNSEIDLRGMDRFFIKLKGGNISSLHISCDLGSVYNPLPFVYSDSSSSIEYEKDKNINVSLNIEYRHAYY